MAKKVKKRPGVGVGLIVVRDGKILLSPRLKPYGFKKLALPGGHVEWMESLIKTAVRETFEEAGIEIDPKKIRNTLAYSEEIHPKLGKHYVTFYLIAACPKGQDAIDKEPHKHGPWGWYDPFNLPKRAWLPTRRIVQHPWVKTMIQECEKWK